MPRILSKGLRSNPWPRRARLRVAAWVALAAGLSGLLLSADLLGGGIEDRVGHIILFQLRGPVAPPPEVVVVAEDRASAEAMGLPFGTGRWPRALHARAIEKLMERHAAVIAFDLMFDTPDPGGDDVLAQALRQAGCVVLLQGLERRILAGHAGSSIEIDQPIDPIPQLAGAAAAVTRFPLPKVPARVDQFWTFHGVTAVPTMPSVLLQLAARDIAVRWTAFLATEPKLQKFAATDWQGAGVVAAMRQLHAALRADPDVADRLRARLRDRLWDTADKQRISALLALYAGEDSRYLNFRGPAGSVRTISYAALFSDPDKQAETVIGDLSGKVVFIGVSELRSATQADAYDTVFSAETGVNITGAEIGATAFADLAEEVSPHRPVAIATIEMILIALALGVAASSARMVGVAAIGASIATGVVVLGWYAFLTRGWFLPVAVPILFQIPAGLLTAAACLRLEERRRRERMAGAARQYLPEEVVRSLASGPLHNSARLTGETRFSVCLASDIEAFTTVSERLPPHTVQTLLNQYFHGMFGVIQRHGGIISDIAGDGVMSVWSAPAYSLPACTSAVAAALELLAVVARFNVAHPDQPLPTRIGVHAGSALVGIVGGAGHYASTVIGDVANTASRIEGLNKQLGTRLLVSEEAVTGVTGFILRPLGTFLLAGKSEPVRVVQVLAPIGDQRAAALAGDFAAAFESFESQRWDEAVKLLEALLRLYPDDGPSSYFLTQALRLRDAPARFHNAGRAHRREIARPVGPPDSGKRPPAGPPISVE